MTGQESLLAAPYWHVRKEDVHRDSATVANPAFASFDVVLRLDYDALFRQNEGLRLGVEAALAHAEALRMDTPEDEAVREKLVETLKLSLVAGRV